MAVGGSPTVNTWLAADVRSGVGRGTTATVLSSVSTTVPSLYTSSSRLSGSDAAVKLA